MNLQQLRQLVGLADTLDFRRAAQRLHISQPPLTVPIRKLEQELGSQLFRRDQRHVALTIEGEAAVVHATQALAAIDALGEAVRAVATGAQGRLRVATFALLRAMAPRFRNGSPSVGLTLRDTTTVEALRALGADELDLAIVRTPVLDVQGTAVEPLTSQELMLTLLSATCCARLRRYPLSFDYQAQAR